MDQHAPNLGVLPPPQPQVIVPLLGTADAMPALGLGTWKLEKSSCAQTVLRALKLGYRHIDCAADYGNEKQVGEGIRLAIAEGVVASRRDIFVASKLWNTFHDPAHVPLALKKTLDDLGLEYLDLYLIHFPVALAYVPIEKRYPPGWVDPTDKEPTIHFANVPLQKTWRAMESLVTETGRVRNIGVSNIKAAQLWDLLTYAKIPPAVIQVERHLYNQQSALVKLCRGRRLTCVGYSPLGSNSYVGLGLASGEGPCDKAAEEPAVRALALRLGKTPAQVLLRWNFQTSMGGTIPKSSKPGRLAENLDVFDFELTDEDIASLAPLDRKHYFNDPAVFMPQWHSWCPLLD